ncbi:hypothetical protein, partial [Pseudomonas sp. PA1(2017)]|uniref:hypothetical protein n=1 Tax=Pseudomonas sp. PA1(2017) TaxID=1932113 RepID=UPI001C46C9D1
RGSHHDREQPTARVGAPTRREAIAASLRNWRRKHHSPRVAAPTMIASSPPPAWERRPRREAIVGTPRYKNRALKSLHSLDFVNFKDSKGFE